MYMPTLVSVCMYIFIYYFKLMNYLVQLNNQKLNE